MNDRPLACHPNMFTPMAASRVWSGVYATGGPGGQLALAGTVLSTDRDLMTEIQRAGAIINYGLGSLTGLLPTRPWVVSSTRTLTNKPTVANNGYVAEGANLPATPTFEFRDTFYTPKQTVFPVDTSTTLEARANRTEEPLAGGLSYFLELSERLLHDQVSKALTADNMDSTGRSGDYTGTLKCEPYDRIISSRTASAAYDGNHNHWSDPYAYTRDGSTSYTWNRDTSNDWDSTVVHASGGITQAELEAATAPITEDALSRAFEGVTTLSNEPLPDLVWTGPDSFSQVAELFSGKVRYNVDATGMTTGRMVLKTNASALLDVDNSISLTEGGSGVPQQISTVNGVPFMRTSFGVKTPGSGASAELSRIYGITFRPYPGEHGLQWEDRRLEFSNFDTRGPAGVGITGALKNLAGYVMYHENACQRPSSQFKIVKLRR